MSGQSQQLEQVKQNNEKREVVYIDIDKIYVPEVRVTSVIDEDLFQELYESIKIHGIREPLQIAEVDGKYVLIDGLHRLVVARKLGMKKVPCLVEKMTMDRVLMYNIIHARQRGKSNPAQEAEVIRKLVEEYGYTLSEAAKQMGMSITWAKKLYDIAQLPEEIKDYIKHGQLTVQNAWLLTRIKDREKQIQLAQFAVYYKYTGEQMKAAVLQAEREDYQPEPGGWQIDMETGQPSKVPIFCGFCGKETGDDRVYIWLHPECLSIIKAFAEEWMKQQALTQQPPQQPQEQPIETQKEKPAQRADWWPYT